MVTVLLLTFSGCSRIKAYSGIAKKAPDEFLVYNRIPPKIPDEFELKPPHSPETKETKIFIDVPVKIENFSTGEKQLLSLLEKTANLQ